MTEKQFILYRSIVYLFSIIYYLGIGIWVIVLAAIQATITIELLGTLIILSSVPHILIYMVNRTKKSYLVIGFVGIVFGILFLTSQIFNIDQICMVWGCIDICRGVTEIINVAPTVKKNRAEFIEIAISIGDIVIGVLLCIHLSNGMTLHLSYLSAAFIITAAKSIAEYIIERKRKHAKRIDNN